MKHSNTPEPRPTPGREGTMGSSAYVFVPLLWRFFFFFSWSYCLDITLNYTDRVVFGLCLYKCSYIIYFRWSHFSNIMFVRLVLITCCSLLFSLLIILLCARYWFLLLLLDVWVVSTLWILGPVFCEIPVCESWCLCAWISKLPLGMELLSPSGLWPLAVWESSWWPKSFSSDRSVSLHSKWVPVPISWILSPSVDGPSSDLGCYTCPCFPSARKLHAPRSSSPLVIGLGVQHRLKNVVAEMGHV